MCHRMLLATSLVLFFTGSMATLVLMIHLRTHRTDLAPHESFPDGKSAAWQWNVYNPDNYSPTGRRRLPWLYCSTVLQLLGLAGLVWSQVG
jgi:hypothetical protein